MDVHLTLDDSGMATWHAVPVVARKNTAPSLPRVSEVLSQRKKSPDLDEIGQDTTSAEPAPAGAHREHREKRRRGRVSAGKTVTFRLASVALDRVVEDVSLNGFWANVGACSPRVGELVSCRYPLPMDDRIHEARLVGRVVGRGQEGFAVQLVRVDEPGEPEPFEGHVAVLSAAKQ